MIAMADRDAAHEDAAHEDAVEGREADLVGAAELRRAPGQFGAAVGVLGETGGVFWLYRSAFRRGVESVKPGTLRGAVPVVIWIAIVLGLTVGGRVLAPAFGLGWLVVVLLIMIPVAGCWPNRRRRDSRDGSA
jgi:hypothetical protein